jgi:hypothetical protein
MIPTGKAKTIAEQVSFLPAAGGMAAVIDDRLRGKSRPKPGTSSPLPGYFLKGHAYLSD